MKNIKFKYLLGFTLVEFMITAALLSIVAALSMPSIQRGMEKSQVERAQHEMEQVLVQAREHRVATGAWPASVATLVAANRLPAGAATSVFNTPYTLSVVAGNNLQLSIDTGAASKAIALAGSQLPFVARAGNTITTRVTPAGQEASVAQLYALDGSRALTGNMNAAGNSINNVNQINATGNITTTSNVQGSDIIATDVVYSQNGFAARSNPAYILRPDGNSNIRNLTAEQIRGTYVESSGAIQATTTITAGGNIATSADFTGRSAYLTQNLQANGTVTAGSLVSTGGIQGVNINASNQVTAPIVRATNRVQSDRFESISNSGYQLTPSGSSNLLDVNARNVGMSYLQVSGNTYTQGQLIVDNGINLRGGDLRSAGNIIGENAIYSRNGFASLNNSSFIVIPDGVSQLNRVNANYLQGGTVTATGVVNAQQFVDLNNPAMVVDPNGNSSLYNLQVQGRATLQDLTMQSNQEAGQPCVASSIGVNAAGELVTCKSGVWAISGGSAGSTVITGQYADGDIIPFPVGFAKNQCSVSVANSTNAHAAKPNYFAGEYAEYNATTRRATCGFYDSNNRYDRGVCAYTVSCSAASITTTTGPIAGESTTQYLSYSTGTSGTINPISGFAKSSCTLNSGSQIPGMTFNVSNTPSGWTYTCTGTAGPMGAPSICNGSISCIN